MLIPTPEGVWRIEHKLNAEMEMPKRHRLTVMREYRKELQFNLISEREAKRTLKKRGTMAILYFAKEDQEKDASPKVISPNALHT
jgi:hypothetical protein